MKANNSTQDKNRRSFLRGSLATGAALLGAGALAESKMFAAPVIPVTPGDIAILRFLAAAELIEADLWIQYAELGGIGSNPPVEVNNPTTPVAPLNPYQDRKSV